MMRREPYGFFGKPLRLCLLLLGLIALQSTQAAVNIAPKFRPGPDLTLVEDSAAVTVPNWATSITPGDNAELGQQLTFVLTNSNPSLFLEQPEISSTGVLHFVPAPDAYGTAVVRAILEDDGGNDDGGRDKSSSHSFLITIKGVNDPPVFTAGPDPTVNEDSGDQVLSGWAKDISVGPPNESLQKLTFVLSVKRPELFAKLPTVDATGTLRFAPARNAYGETTVTIYAQDSGGTANGGKAASESGTFAISILPVNDPPQLGKIADVNLLEDAGAQSMAGWVKSILAGPSNESEQSLALSVVNDNSALFDVPPTIGLDGKLSFTPAHDANGVAHVTVKLSDDGGKERGGNDTSLAQTFTITMQPVNDPPTFDVGPDQTVLEDSGPRIVANLAANISVGSPKEASEQNISAFVVTNNNPRLFETAPAVDVRGTLTFTPAKDAFGAAQVTIRAKDSGPAAGSLNWSAPYSFKITVEPVNDPPRISPLQNLTVLEDVGQVRRANWAKGISSGPTNERTQSVTITTTTTNSQLFLLQPVIETNGALTFAAASNQNGSATVLVTIKDDGGTNQNGSDSTTVSFGIVVEAVNDPPSFTKGADQTVTSGAGPQRVVGWATNLSVGPADEAQAGQKLLDFVVTNSNAALFARQPAITADGTLSFAPVPGAIGNATVRVHAKDNGGTNRSGLDQSAAQAFSISVIPDLEPPSFAAGTNQTVNEDSGARMISGWAKQVRLGPSNIPGLKLSFKATAADPKLFATQPAVDPNGTLSFEPAPNAFGETSVSISAAHSGSRATGGIQTSKTNTFTITVLPVNDPPAMTKIATNIEALEDAGRLTFANWAKGLSVGPSNENSQVISFSLTNDNPRLFEIQPAIAPDGTLSFTTAHDANGLAVVTVRLQDNGGRERGGNDSAPSDHFTISILPVNDPPTFHAGADQTWWEDAGPRVVTNWATEISVGSPLEEATQRFAGFVLTNDNAALFSSGPLLDLAGNLSFTPAPNAVGTAHVIVRAKDTGPETNGNNLSAPHTLNIHVEPVNDQPQMAAIPNVSIFEEAGRVSLTNWVKGLSAGPQNEAAQQMTLIVAAATTNRMFSVPPTIDSSGTLNFSTAPDAIGKARVAVTLQDDGGTNHGGIDSLRLSFEILIRPVNDPPRFVKGPDQAILSSAAQQRMEKWATGLSVGPPDEAAAGQKLLDFEVSTDQPSLFAREPEISANGTLSFRPASKAAGVAKVSVRAKDNGGTKDGGIDLSEPQTFTITIALPPGTPDRATSTEAPPWQSIPLRR